MLSCLSLLFGGLALLWIMMNSENVQMLHQQTSEK